MIGTLGRIPKISTYFRPILNFEIKIIVCHFSLQINLKTRLTRPHGERKTPVRSYGSNKEPSVLGLNPLFSVPIKL